MRQSLSLAFHTSQPFLALSLSCLDIGDDRNYLTMVITFKCEVRIAGKGVEVWCGMQ